MISILFYKSATKTTLQGATMNIRARATVSILTCATAALLAGCAAPVTQRVGVDASDRAREERVQQRLAIQSHYAAQKRLMNVGYGILKGAASECGEITRPNLGIYGINKDRLTGPSRDITIEALNVTDEARVDVVMRGGAAEAAGVKAGDILLSRELLAGSAETRHLARERLPGPVKATFRRDGQEYTTTITPDTICDYPLTASNGAEVNAYADGKQIVVTRGMIRFATDDRELALVVAHELGHNTMGHLDKKKTNFAIGAVFDILAAAYRVNTNNAFANAGASAFSQDFESEADYVGVYYLARAGYPTEGAADFWRRMAAEFPGSIKSNHAASHPATSERFLAIDQVASEVRTKMDNGSALTPNRIK